MTDTPKPRDPRTPRGEYAKSATTRTAILDAAAEVFAETGYRSAALRGIALRAGMSEAGLLHHFPNKAALLTATLERRDQEAESIIDLRSDGAATLKGLVRIAEINALKPGVVALFSILSAEATSSDHPAHSYFVDRYDAVRAAIREAYEKLHRAGALHAGADPARAAVSTIALMDGLQVQWLLDNEALDMAAELRAFFTAFVDIDFDAG